MNIQEFYEKYNYPRPTIYNLDRSKDRIHIPSNSPQDVESDILVAGCGTIEAAMVANVNPCAKVVGIDISKNSLTIQKSIKRRFKLKNLRLLQDDIISHEGDYDLVMSNCVLHHIKNVELAINNIYLLLREGGVFVGSVYSDLRPVYIRKLSQYFKDNNFTVQGVKNYLQSKNDEWYKKHVTYDAEIADTWLHPYYKDYSDEDLRSLIEAVGFTEIATKLDETKTKIIFQCKKT